MSELFPPSQVMHLETRAAEPLMTVGVAGVLYVDGRLPPPASPTAC